MARKPLRPRLVGKLAGKTFLKTFVTFVKMLAPCTREPAGTRQQEVFQDAHRTNPGMTERASRSRVAASTTGLAEVGTEDRKVRSVDARLRRRRKLAPARSNSAALSIALIVFDTAPCPPTRNCLLAANVPPPRGPCFAIDACFAIEAGLFLQIEITQPLPGNVTRH